MNNSMSNFVDQRDYTGLSFANVVERVSGFPLTRYSRDQYQCGPVYYGKCPFCLQGLESFHVRCSDYISTFACSECLVEGDAVQFLVRYCQMTEPEALVALYGEGGRKEASYLYVPQPDEFTRDAPPSAKWARQAQLLQEYAVRQLWHTKAGRQALKKLRGEGLRDETIKNANLGYIPPNFNAGPYPAWGLDYDDLSPEHLFKGYHHLMLPEGILYPYTSRDAEIWKLVIREDIGPYATFTIPGSREGMFNLEHVQDYTEQFVMMVHSEFDALLVSQLDIPGIIGVATGGLEEGRYYKWINALSHVALVFQSFCVGPYFDLDAAYWMKVLPNAMRYTFPAEHDHYETLAAFAHDHGQVALKNWVRDGLELVIRWLDKHLKADEEA